MTSTAPVGHAVDPTDLTAEDSRVFVPHYDRNRLTPAVVHLGVGGFHRAHQAVYFDRLAEQGHTGWGVVGVGISRPALGQALAAQDGLYVVVERGDESSNARLVGCMVDYLLLADNPAAVEACLADPRTRLVTMTVTADGYRVDQETLAGGSSIFEPVVKALDTRRTSGLPPFTVLSCDNLPDSGAAARAASLAVARHHSTELADWIAERVCFPSSMVDRITPQTSEDDRDEIVAELGVADRSPVVTEAFAQWIIEDCFSDGRPPLDTVGAQFVADVAPYKLIKSRLLNGTHSAIGYLGSLAGHRTSAEAMADAEICRFVERLMREEVVPGLPADVAGMELDSYVSVLLERFASSAIADQLTRLCRRGSTKLADYLLPSLLDATEAGRPRRLLALVVAAWLRYLQGTSLDGKPFEVVDPRADELQPLARQGAAALLGVRDLFGDLGGDAGFVAEVDRLVTMLDDVGVAATIREASGTRQ